MTDYFATFNTVQQSNADTDLGSGGTLVLPDLVDGAGQIRRLAVGAGKDAHIYVVDRGNSRKVTLRRAELQEKFPGLLDVIRLDAAANRSSSTK